MEVPSRHVEVVRLRAERGAVRRGEQTLVPDLRQRLGFGFGFGSGSGFGFGFGFGFGSGFGLGGVFHPTLRRGVPPLVHPLGAVFHHATPAACGSGALRPLSTHPSYTP